MTDPKLPLYYIKTRDDYNAMPAELRRRLAPFLRNLQVQHLRQARYNVVAAHKRLLDQIDTQIKTLEEWRDE